jgi:hypothetical protein
MYNTRELIASTASASIRELPMNSSSGLTRTILNLVCRVCNLISNFNCVQNVIAKRIEYGQGHARDALNQSVGARL